MATEKVVIPDASELFAELDGIALTLLGISNQLSGDCDRLTEESLVEVFFSLQRHILRIAEDWMIYSEMMEERARELHRQREMLKDRIRETTKAEVTTP